MFSAGRGKLKDLYRDGMVLASLALFGGGGRTAASSAVSRARRVPCLIRPFRQVVRAGTKLVDLEAGVVASVQHPTKVELVGALKTAKALC